MSQTTETNDDTPWKSANPEKRLGINVPFPEPLMVKLDYLIEHRAITSKSSFIRECVASSADVEIKKLRRLQAAMRHLEEEDRLAKQRKPAPSSE